MRLHILGCGDAFGSGGRNQSAYLIEAPDRLFLLDCGATSLLALKKLGFNSGQLDAIFLSHLHGDHFGGLPFFFIEFLYEKSREKPLHVAGPAGTEEKARAVFDLMYGKGTKAGDLASTCFHVLEPEKTSTIQGIEVFPFRVPHQVNEISLALKVSYNGKHVLYSGDSAWTDVFLEHAREVDLFVCECTHYDRETSNHMSYLQLREQLPRLRCPRIILTHMGYDMLARGAEISCAMAEDGMVVEI
ncbi:MAG: fold metallo-hydrolase [Deltaproteobacteria bacterium]|jgi:ribonuclease BN (tRNA processing enzyme)|nr:fold metallo-hydrolase [Deltaproteobacteria bacterium]